MKPGAAAGPLAALPAALVFALCGSAGAQVAPVPIVLPQAPPPLGATGSTLFAARLAIARAAQIDPQAAQTASFVYVKAVQQYRSGNIAGANASALQALSTASQAQVLPAVPAPVPAASLAPAATQQPGVAGGLYGADAAAIDADSFLALARGTLDDCAARRDHRLAAAQSHYAQAEHDFALRNWQATRVDAKAAIDACAKPRS
ncbi:MAG: hypothetical protein ABSB70_18765 [Candidatus Velthaea sp.]